MAGTFKVDFTQDDVQQSGARDFEPIPTGIYEADITGIELVEVQNGANKGKPMFKVEATLSDEPYNNRKQWFNVMLFNLPSGNWFLAQFLKATGNGYALETGEIPSAEDFDGKHVSLSVKRVKDDYKNKKDPKPDGSTWFKNQVNGFKFDEEGATTTAKPRSKKVSILP